MSKLKIVDKHSEISIMSERNLLLTLNHSFIVNMYFAFQDFYNLYLVLDLLTGGDLRYHIAQKRIFTESETKFFISNMIIALEYIHSKNIIHRDIKPENLVLESSGYLRITDFGVAKINERDNSSETSGTPGYMAPEVILVLNHSFPSDFFALGVIGYEFMLGYRPYLGRSRKEIKELIINKQAKLKKEDIPEDWSEESMDFINKLLKRKAEKRLGYNGIDELKNHSWMNNIDWEKLEMKKIKPPFIPNKKENYDKNYCEEEEEIGEETIERYQIYAQSDLYPDVFKNYTFCNLSYISNYHIKRLKRFKENNIKIKDIVEQNVNKVLNEEKDLFKFKKLEKLEKLEKEKINIINNKHENINHNNFSINKNHSKSVENLNQYNFDNLNKDKEIELKNKEIKDKSKTIINEIKNKKENESQDKDKGIDKESKNNIDIINNQLNNDKTNSNYYTIEANKTNSGDKKKSSNQKAKLSKYKRNKEYIKNYKENIIYNNYINLHFNNFLNNRNFNSNNIYKSSLSKKKNINCKANSNLTNKTKSKFNSKNITFKNKKNVISKSGSEKILDNNKNIFNQFLSLNKKINKNNKIIPTKKQESRTINIENKNGIKLNTKKLDIKYFLYNKKYDLLLDIINSNEKKNNNFNDKNSKKKEIKKKGNGNKIGKSYSSCGFYTNEKILTTQRKKKNNIKLLKLNRNLSMHNIYNNYDIIHNNINYQTLMPQSNYSKNNSKRKNGIIKKNEKYNAFSSSISSSKSKSSRKSKKFHKDKDNNKKKNSPGSMKNQNLIKFLNEYNLINKRKIKYNSKTYKSL